MYFIASCRSYCIFFVHNKYTNQLDQYSIAGACLGVTDFENLRLIIEQRRKKYLTVFSDQRSTIKEYDRVASIAQVSQCIAFKPLRSKIWKKFQLYKASPQIHGTSPNTHLKMIILQNYQILINTFQKIETFPKIVNCWLNMDPDFFTKHAIL